MAVRKTKPASRIVIARAGTYKFDLFAQLSSTSASAKNVWLWFAKNGTAIANSAAIETETANNAYASMFRSELMEMSAGDYVEAYFAVNDVALFLHAAAATAFAPAAPSAHLAVTQVS